ncbi:uncharacterized protein LOC128674470 [Plodia interpunctella]|uniref:uncharacterized protein LOC128674470 n=1 Tax=Plodia interpunctella TaxID=58824 RepID=UPI0023687367|nr:uncharacterized protein LOC128674470 [Plodia interpunctella]
MQRTPPKSPLASATNLLSATQFQSDPNLSTGGEHYVSLRNKRKRHEESQSNLDEFKEEMKDFFKSLMSAQQKQLEKNTVTLKEIQRSSSNIENSVAFLTAQNEELKKTITQLQEERKEDKKHIAMLEDKIENMQMDVRKTNLEIKNVPKKPNESKEDLVDMVLNLSRTVGSQIKKEDIKDVFRVRVKKEGIQNPPIIIETSSTLIKNDVLKLCKAFNVRQKTKLCAKHLGLKTHEDTPVFVTEQLTAKAARMFFLARDLVKSNSFKFCWTAYGKVYVRKNENSPIIQIKNETAIQDLRNNK